MTRIGDALAVAGVVILLAGSAWAVAVAGPHAGLVTAAVGLAVCGIGAVVGAVGMEVRR